MSYQQLNTHARSEANLQGPIVRLDFEQADDPTGTLLIRARHDRAAQPADGTQRSP
jgi:hypothetical protein